MAKTDMRPQVLRTAALYEATVSVFAVIGGWAGFASTLDARGRVAARRPREYDPPGP